jgi:CheY-like chemotaxis protein
MDEAAHPLALVVDDEEILRLFAAGLLEEHGFDVWGPRTRQRR